MNEIEGHRHLSQSFLSVEPHQPLQPPPRILVRVFYDLFFNDLSRRTILAVQITWPLIGSLLGALLLGTCALCSCLCWHYCWYVL